MMRVLWLCGWLQLVLPVQAQVWHELPSMPTPRHAAVAATLNGYLYVIGGIGAGDSLLGTVEAYDPVRRTWIRELPQLDEPRAYAATVVLNDRIYLIGGLEGETLEHAEATDEVLVFHPENGWEDVASLKEARYGLAAVVFEGRIYAIGGYAREAQAVDRLAPQPLPLSAIEAYDPQRNSWETVAHLPQAVALAAAVTLGEDIYIIGGLSRNFPVTLIQRFRPKSNTVVSLPSVLPQEWWAGAALTYRNQIILLGGLGGDRENAPLARVSALQITGDQVAVRDLPPLLQPRFSFAATTYNDTMFVFGGLDRPEEGHPIASAEAAPAATLTPREDLPLPADFELAAPSPHPFRTRVTFTFSISTRLPHAPVQLVVYDLLGRPVARLLNRPLSPGRHTFTWTGTDAAGHPVPAGVYLVCLTQGPYQQERLLIRTR